MKRMFLLLCAALSFVAEAKDKTVKIAAYERRPFLVNDRAEKGYVYDLAVEIFKAQGYKVDIEFLPLARAKSAVKKGEYDVLIPSYNVETDYDYSDGLPGDQIGFLAVKGKHGINAKTDISFAKQLDLIKGKNVGIVRGVETGTDFDKDSSIQKSAADRVVQNIDKLVSGRVDLVLTDKYEAADVLVSERPHLIGQLEFLRPALVENSFRIAVGKSNPAGKDLIQDFNSGLEKFKKNGRYKEILFRYGYSDQTPDEKTINIATVENGDMKVMQELSKDWEKANPGIKLNWYVLPENVLRQRIFSSLAIFDDQFDVMTIGAYDTPIYAKKGWIAPLKDLPADYAVDDLLASIRDGLSYEKQLYALPFYGESSMTFYRTDLFKKAGLEMPEKPTYAQIKEFAAKLHNPKEKQYGICLRGKAGWGENMALVGTMINSYGSAWFDMQWKPLVNSKNWQEAIGTYVDILKNYGPSDAAENGFGENLKLFADGHCAMWIDATVAAGMVFDKKQSKVADKVGFTAAPIGSVDKGSNWMWSWALAIPTSSTRQELGKKFVAWATSKKYIEQVAKKKGWVAVPPGTRRSTYLNENYKKAAPFAPVVLKLIESADPVNSTAIQKPYLGVQFVSIPEFPAIGMQVGNTVNGILRGKVSTTEGLSEAQKEVEKVMQKSGYLK